MAVEEQTEGEVVPPVVGTTLVDVSTLVVPGAPVTPPLPDSMIQLLNDWRGLADKASDRHSRACDRYHRMDSFYGIGSTVLTALIGSTIFITLQKSTSETLRIIAGIVGAIAAIGSAVQTAGKYAKSAEEYRQASRTYSTISRQIAEITAQPPPQAQWITTMDGLRKSLNDAGAMAPNVPPGIWNQETREERAQRLEKARQLEQARQLGPVTPRP